MWGAVTFHAEKIRVGKVARANGWNYALNACSGSGASTVDGGDNVMSGIDSATSTAGNNPTSSMPGGETNVPSYSDSGLNDEKGYAFSEETGSVSMPGLIGGTGYEPRGYLYVRCNEDPPPENLGDLAMNAFKMAKGLWPF